MSDDADGGSGEPGIQRSEPRSGPALALRRAFWQGYGWDDFRADLLAGLVVGVVALPLAMALAVASGVPPQHGLYTAIVAGGLIAVLGGSKVQVSGPTAAFVVLLAPISARYGLGGLLVATMIAGLIQVLMGMARMGRLIQFIPYPVTTGFTTGIAVVIATLQIKDFFGLDLASLPPHFVEKVAAIARAFPTVHWPDLAIGALTLGLLLGLPRLTRRIPAPILALPLAGLAAWVAQSFDPALGVETIRSRFPDTDGVPRLLPTWQWPWLQPGADGAPLLDLLDQSVLQTLFISGFAIAMLGSIESLLSAVIADGMTGKKHDPDSELLAQGTGNVIAPFFGGFAATGAIARTATNIRSGARSPIAALVHAVFILVCVLAAAPLLGYLPMAAMAALLLIVAWNMSEIRHFVHMLRVAPASDILVLLTCFGLTVIFDMVIAVSVGVVLAALLFMRRMAEVADFRLVGGEHPAFPARLPKGVMVYDVAGPLFFGAAQRAMSSLSQIQRDVHVVLLDLTDVPHMDATGLVNFESVLDRLRRAHVYVVIAGVQDQPLRLMRRAGWDRRDWVVIWPTFDQAITFVMTLSDSDVARLGAMTAPAGAARG